MNATAHDNFAHDLTRLSAPTRTALDRAPAHFIDGKWLPAQATLPVIDPSSGAPIAAIGAGGAEEIDQAVRAARQAFKSPAWAQMGPMSRERLLHRLARQEPQRAGVGSDPSRAVHQLAGRPGL